MSPQNKLYLPIYTETGRTGHSCILSTTIRPTGITLSPLLSFCRVKCKQSYPCMTSSLDCLGKFRLSHKVASYPGCSHVFNVKTWERPGYEANIKHIALSVVQIRYPLWDEPLWWCKSLIPLVLVVLFNSAISYLVEMVTHFGPLETSPKGLYSIQRHLPVYYRYSWNPSDSPTGIPQ